MISISLFNTCDSTVPPSAFPTENQSPVRQSCPTNELGCWWIYMDPLKLLFRNFLFDRWNFPDTWRSSRAKNGKLTLEFRFDPKAKYKNVSLIFSREFSPWIKISQWLIQKWTTPRWLISFQVPKFTSIFQQLNKNKLDIADRIFALACFGRYLFEN